jgi:hypothetical protein
MKLAILAAAAVLAFSSAAGAQSAAAADPAAVAAAREMLVASGFEGQMEQAALQNVQATFNTVLEAREKELGAPMPQELKAGILSLLQADTRALVAEMRKTALDDAARIYARYFTAAEIEELQALQTHPVMVKAQRVSSGLMTELMQLGIKPAAERQPQLQAKIQKLIADWSKKQK